MSFLKNSRKEKKNLRFNPPAISTVIPEPLPDTLRNGQQTRVATSTDPQQLASPVLPCSLTLKRTEKNGLFLISPVISPSSGGTLGESYLIDIVAIHGITGDAYDTWTHENGKLWLRDFLPKSLPGVRVFSYGYPAEIFCSLNTGNIDTFGRSLLEGLKGERRQKEVGFVS